MSRGLEDGITYIRRLFVIARHVETLAQFQLCCKLGTT